MSLTWRLQHLPLVIRRSFSRLAGRRPILRLPSHSFHFVTRLSQVVGSSEDCPAHCHFSLQIFKLYRKLWFCQMLFQRNSELFSKLALFLLLTTHTYRTLQITWNEYGCNERRRNIPFIYLTFITRNGSSHFQTKQVKIIVKKTDSWPGTKNVFIVLYLLAKPIEFEWIMDAWNWNSLLF